MKLSDVFSAVLGCIFAVMSIAVLGQGWHLLSVLAAVIVGLVAFLTARFNWKWWLRFIAIFVLFGAAGLVEEGLGTPPDVNAVIAMASLSLSAIVVAMASIARFFAIAVTKSPSFD